MPRIAALDLAQINRQIDNIDSLQSQVSQLKTLVNNIGFQTAVSDPTHAPDTTNNVTFTWTGSTTTLSWAASWIKDKNWSAQTTSTVPPVSSAPGSQHIYAIPAGSLILNASSYYWLGWDSSHQAMIATSDASKLHGNQNVHIICQIFTGTSGQTGTAGGGGGNGGVDLSGARYKNF